MFLNRMPRYEVLSQDALTTIERGWQRLAREVGVQFDHPRALELFREAGQTVDGDVVRFDPEFLHEQVAKAPSEFTLHARNPGFFHYTISTMPRVAKLWSRPGGKWMMASGSFGTSSSRASSASAFRIV